MLRYQVFLMAVSVVASISLYLAASAGYYRTGFPLDDAWIHQTYARNLAQSGEWAFLPGQPSAGSTAPLWSWLLALGHLVGLGPQLWTYFLGGLLLFGAAWQGGEAFGSLCKRCNAWKLAAGVLLAFEWHLVWASASGMETLLLACIILFVIAKLLAGWENWFVLGIVVGASVWVRPDGLTLLGPIAFVIILRSGDLKNKIIQLSQLSLGFFGLTIPYAVFNWRLSGSWLPNTFFAKQAEYAIELQTSLLSRLAEQALQPLVGVGALLLPGFLIFLYKAIRQKSIPALATVLWLLGYLTMYAIRLPVIYQHARYLQPAMPAYFLLGFAGITIFANFNRSGIIQRVLGRAWVISTAVTLVLFWFIGANAYRQDVAIIESEMVDTAHWIKSNTPAGSTIAAHDIGAIGYFSNRPLIDLAGLVSPEVIGFIRDEQRLANFLDEKQVDYLVTFPGWYPGLVSGQMILYQGVHDFSSTAGGEHMSVYRWSH
jgi:hypothetical protein